MPHRKLSVFCSSPALYLAAPCPPSRWLRDNQIFPDISTAGWLLQVYKCLVVTGAKCASHHHNLHPVTLLCYLKNIFIFIQ